MDNRRPQVESRNSGTIKPQFEVGNVLSHKETGLTYAVIEVDGARSEYKLYGVINYNNEWEKAPTPMGGTDSIRVSFQEAHSMYSRIQE